MTLRNRLTKLEPSAREAHARAWERYWALDSRHTDPVVRLVRDPDLFKKAVLADDPEFEPVWGDFSQLSGYHHDDDLELWGLAYEHLCPELGTVPALAMWPHAFPTPPAEPPELWNRLMALADDPDPNRRVCAVMTLLVLAAARGVRDFKGGSNP